MEFDWILFLTTIAVSVFGLVAVYSATRSLGSGSDIIVQCAAWGIGVVFLFFACFFDYEQFKPVIKYVAAACLLMLVAVLILGSVGKWGSKSWIRLGAVSIQPSEFVKIGFILTFSYHLSQVKEKINKPVMLLLLAVHAVTPILLILLQPDMGSALVFVFIFAVMLFCAKLSYKYIFPAIGILIVAMPSAYAFLLNPVQQKRIQIFFNPESEALGAGYNVIQSKIAIGGGGLFGKGYLSGTQNQMGYLPAKETDFIFSTICEEWGFIGGVLLIVALFLIIYRCFKISTKADNLFGRYICAGVGAMLLFHTVENVGMCMGLLPVTGIPLPFISYGGSSMVTNFISVGLVMSVAYHNKPRGIFEVY